MSLIIIILAISVPSFLSYQDRQNEEQFMNQAINRLRSYQSLAITKDTITNFSNSAKSISFCDTNCNSISFNKDIFTSNNSLSFNSIGEVTTSNNTVISNDVILKGIFFQIRINKHGGIFKENVR